MRRQLYLSYNAASDGGDRRSRHYELWRRRLQRKQGRKSAAQQEERLNRDVLPILGELRAREVTRGDIKSLLSDIIQVIARNNLQ